MSEITWPLGLSDHVQADGYDEPLPDSSLEFAVAQGPPISRRRGSSAVQPLTLSQRCTPYQKDLLTTFYAVTTASGTLPFTWKRPAPDASGVRAACRMQFVSGQPPRFKPRGSNWTATFNVRVLP